MSTNEQNKTQDTNQNGNQKSKTLNSLENKSLNSVESVSNSKEESKGKDVVDPTSPGNEEEWKIQGGELFLKIADNEESGQTLTNENGIEESGLLVNKEVPELNLENSVIDDADMSRSGYTKSRLPNKTASRSALTHQNAKIHGELTGQPSTKNTKEDTKYWKGREQELLSKIAELEKKVSEKSSKFQGSLDPSAKQIQEKLQNDLEAITREKENYKNRLQAIEKELVNKQKEISTDQKLKNLKSSEEVINHLKLQNEDLRSALAKMTAILRDKTTLCISQEKKIAALTNQIDSLKEVVAITKDLLNIRNMEVQHLSNDISAMETKIDCERQRHNQMLIKMDEAVKLNSELKKEYENQLKLFQHLRSSYEEKILLLSRDGNVEKTETCSVGKRNTNEISSNSHA